MAESGRERVLKWWGEAWDEGLWAASWKKSLEGLTAEQAAWQPPSAPGVPGLRHSIWQIVEHMIFWRESWTRRVEGGRKHTDEEYKTGNFPVISDRSEGAWAASRARFEETQKRAAAALKDRGEAAAILEYFLPHDCYHFGQINYLRAMLGLKAIE